MQRFNSIVTIKTGCVECPEGNEKPIYARGMCAFHYKIFRNKARQDRVKEREPILKEQYQSLWNFFQECVKKCELRCAECGERIYTKDKTAHWHIAHILKKEFFKSVQTNEDNWIELCWQCHQTFDQYMQDKDERLMEMRIFPVVIEKIKILKPYVSEHRRFNGLPLFILNKI